MLGVSIIIKSLNDICSDHLLGDIQEFGSLIITTGYNAFYE